MNWIEAIATVAGLICVGLLVRESIWNFPFAIVQVSLSIYVFYAERLYSDVILHVIYVILNVYGWIYWSRGTKRAELPVTRLTPRALAGWVLLTAVLTVGWGTLAKQVGAAAPYVDAAILMGSLAAQYLTARKKLESWWFWIAVDLIAIPLYASRDLEYFAWLYAVFLVLCILGIWQWRQSISPAPKPAGV